MILNGVFFVTHKGDLIASHTNVAPAAMRTLVEIFRTEIVLSTDKCGAIHKLDDKPTWLVYIAEKELFIVASLGDDRGGSQILRLLHDITVLCHRKMGDLTVQNIRNNSCWLQCVLDSLFTDGVFQPIDIELLQVLTKGRIGNVPGSIVRQPNPVSSGPQRMHKFRNDIYIEIVNKISLVLSREGKTIMDKSIADVRIKSSLNPTQSHQLTLARGSLPAFYHQGSLYYSDPNSERSGLHDAIFHPCVDLTAWKANERIQFLPPEASEAMTLMSFRSEQAQESVPFIIHSFERDQNGDTRSEIELKLQAAFPSKYQAENIVVTIPCPQTTTTVNLYLSTGRAKYKPEKGAIRWKIPSMGGQTEESFSAEIICIAPTYDTQKPPRHQPPVSVSFSIPSYNSCGYRVAHVRNLQFGSKEVAQFVKYSTQAASYEVRVE